VILLTFFTKLERKAGKGINPGEGDGRVGVGGVRGSHIKRMGVLVVPFRGQKLILVPLTFKSSTAGVFAVPTVPFRVLSPKNI